ncbi:ATP synthase subunit gamma, mitochondrial-like [Mizuhopecten yessoensis]|uniref:ATP synthase subunit gamma n=1 Tax=Mizuhopecten yessoensis TaxID=6573 RepID=A0A210Q163_MIZYE|nr:ATP synthase subunit gamma, mitochondrial-like [Mizuhopecten yessoensis]OWF42490.1 ATP synthase subunit gamma, mitochondrial [Mizuhopecten yessoensis]
MFSRTAQVFVPQCTQVRGMATLKEIRLRLKSITNIQKITKSMKMVSAAKFAKAERELKPARVYGHGAKTFYEHAEVTVPEGGNAQVFLALTSDRGLCGACHSSIAKTIRTKMGDASVAKDAKLVLVGDKAKAILHKPFANNMLLSFNDIGKTPPVFKDAATVAQSILDSGFKFDVANMYYNTFKTVVSYKTSELPLFTADTVANAKNISLYDSLDQTTLACYNEFSMANLIYYGLKESACSEQSSRMTAMDAASKNAGEMIDKLTLTFNRTRQAVITRELIEIISGAAAL